MNFEKQIKAFEKKANLAVNKAMCNAFEYLAIQNVELTANGNINYGGFSNGDIANNWHVSEGGPNVPIPNGPNLSGIDSLSRIKRYTSSLPFTKDIKVYLCNAMNYSYRANYLGWPIGLGTNGWNWTSGIKGYGFIQRSITNLKAKY